MSERPIIFSGAMVRALLDGRKTQTRRLIKPSGHASLFDGTWTDDYVLDPGNAEWRQREVRYALGDLLYVREAWRAGYSQDWRDDALGRAPRPSEFDPNFTAIEYLSDQTHELSGRNRSPLHMPRWASRLTLEVTDVEVEHLQSITYICAKAEGVNYLRGDEDPRESFRHLWDSLNAKRAPWSSNPWIVAVTFKVHKLNIDGLVKQRAAA